jgi:hypothetical protein
VRCDTFSIPPRIGSQAFAVPHVAPADRTARTDVEDATDSHGCLSRTRTRITPTAKVALCKALLL